MFQLYYLARVLNPDAFEDAITVNSVGKTDPPEVIIRQFGLSRIQIFLIKARVVHKIHGFLRVSVLSCFDPAMTLYFFEPDASLIEPNWGLTTNDEYPGNVCAYNFKIQGFL